MASWTQDPKTLKLIPKEEYQQMKAERSAALHLSPEPYKSPIDGTIIDDRGKLREHNTRHGVTDVRDYGPEYFERKHKERGAEIQGKTPEARRDRIEAIKRTMYMMGQQHDR